MVCHINYHIVIYYIIAYDLLSPALPRIVAPGREAWDCCMYVCICIYIYRERERARVRET